jgi:PadR family transcriptional regulator PadR
MPRPVAREFFLGFVKLHILHHAGRVPVYGLALIRELGRHGYSLSPGTLYPTLHALERAGYLISRPAKIDGKRRRLYRATPAGRRLLAVAARKAHELMDELEGPPVRHRR